MLMADYVICQVKGGETLDWSNCYAPSLVTCPFPLYASKNLSLKGWAWV